MDTPFTLLGGAITLTGPRPPEDALWLAAALPQFPPQSTILDAGTGSGILSLALLHHQPALHVTALDLTPTHAAANAKHNRRALTVLTADLLTYQPQTLFDAAVSNPPFHLAHSPSSSAAKNQAHAATPDFLQKWLAALLALTTPAGSVHLVTHTATLPHLQALCAPYHTIIRPLATHPHNSPERPPKRVLVHIHKSQPPGWHQASSIPAHNPSLRQQVLALGKSL